MRKDAIQILETGQSRPQVFSEWWDFKIGLTKEYDHLPTVNHMDFIIKNWNNLDCLNEKFDELREKEINNELNEIEKSLLKNVLKKRILEFPNPYLPLDHKEAVEMSRKYGILDKEDDKATLK